MRPFDHQLPTTTYPESHARPSAFAAVPSGPSDTMAMNVQPYISNRSEPFLNSRTLPPLSRGEPPFHAGQSSSTSSSPSTTTFAQSPTSRFQTAAWQSRGTEDLRSPSQQGSGAWHQRQPDHPHTGGQSWSLHNQLPDLDDTNNPAKRPRTSTSYSVDRWVDYAVVSDIANDDRYSQYSPTSYSAYSIENTASPYRNSVAQNSISSVSPQSGFSTPARSRDPVAVSVPPFASPYTSHSDARRYSLHLRQQPRAARAGPDGKDRRAIDPPPILQLMMTDFDPDSEEDLDDLKSGHFVVHCRLVSAQSPTRELSVLSSTNDDGSVEVQRLLLGTTVSSPFYCTDDPDPESMPQHPRSEDGTPARSASPTSRFIRSNRQTSATGASRQSSLPGAFFIFADLSIRKAGEYRLEFRLMKVEQSTMSTGSKLPILHSVTSHVFRGVNAKDFDQVQPSTELVKGLLDRGAGFPLKLKKGIREGQKGRSVDGEDEDEPDDDD